MYNCKKCGAKNLRAEDMDRGREGRPSLSCCKKCRHKSQYQNKLRKPKFHLFHMAKHRAKRNGLPFDLTIDDFDIPQYCPVLGIKLKPGLGKLHDASPSLDRIKPEMGYVKDNVVVISYKANRMKSNATTEEVEKLAKWMRDSESADNTEGRLENIPEPVTTNTLSLCKTAE